MRNFTSILSITMLALACTSDDSTSATGETEGTGAGTDATGTMTTTTPSTMSDPTTEGATSTGPTTMADSTGDDTSATAGTADTGETDAGPGCVGDGDCAGGTEPFCLQGVCVSCSQAPLPDAACAAADPAAPFCINGACVPCSNGNVEVTCEVTDPELPACLDGVCVECSDANTSLCEGATPACVAGECAPCSFHFQCPQSACDLWTGQCLDAERQTVGPALIHDFSTLTEALDSVPAAGVAVFVVHEKPGNAPYAESLLVTGGRTIAILGAEGMRPIVQGAEHHAIRLDPDATLFIENLRFSGFDPGVSLIPINTSGGRLALDRTEVVDNRGAVRLGQGTEARLRNTVIGVSYTSTAAIRVSGASLDAEYSTFIAEGTGVGISTYVPAGIVCTSPVAVNVRNSIISNVHATTESIWGCDEATVTYSATREAFAGTGNVVVGTRDTDWFAGWPGDLRLSAEGATVFADIAQWQAGDPPTDLDDNARPTMDGAADYAGGHRP